MRCYYLSDLHLESQDFVWPLPRGDVLLVAGDLAHASALGTERRDPYALAQRERVQRFLDAARRSFDHVLVVAGNHDHYDGHFEATVPVLRQALPGCTVLDDSHVDIAGVRFFGATLWSDFEGRSATSMARARKGVGEYFFVKTRIGTADGEPPRRLLPTDTLAAHDATLVALEQVVAERSGRPVVVVTHHAPSRRGANPVHAGNGLDGAYTSDLDRRLERLDGIVHWVHGHTHVRIAYRIGNVPVVANCRGFDKRDPAARQFRPDRHFDVG